MSHKSIVKYDTHFCHMRKRLIPPFRFGYVEKDVFRGGYPVALNFDFLKTLHLKTIVSIIPNPVDDDLKKFCEEEHITSHYYQIPEYAGQIVITASQITEIMTLMCNTNNLPLYIHSVGGGHTSGLVVLCLRRLQMWSTHAMVSEFNQYVMDGIESCEEEFISNFKATIELPLPRPRWLTQLSGQKTHPTMRVILPDETSGSNSEDDDDPTSDEADVEGQEQ